jgi:C-terminal processing protease CtpA/Prc
MHLSVPDSWSFPMSIVRVFALRAAVVACFLPFVSPARSQQISDLDRQRAQQMLKTVGDDVRKHCYDPKFHGVDLDKEIADSKQRIEKVNSMNMALSNIAAALDALDDSHTFFLPPQHAMHHEYGWEYQMVGEHCFITEVRPKSDADAKGVKPGDELLSINGIVPRNRSTTAKRPARTQ